MKAVAAFRNAVLPCHLWWEKKEILPRHHPCLPRQHIKKQRHYFDNKGPSSQCYGFSISHVWTWELTLKKAECWRIDAFKLIVYIVLYCNRFIILSHNYYVKGKHIKKKSKTNSQRIDAFVVLEKTLESPLVCKEMQPVHPKGDQSWVLIGGTDVEAETPILWPPDGKNWLIWKDPDAGKD